MKTHPIGTKTTLYFNCIVLQGLCWATPLRPSARTTTRRHYTSIEEAWILSLDNDNGTTPLITQESHSDYQHPSILTHSNSTTTTIPWLCPPTTSKIVIAGCVCSPIPPCLWKCESSFRIREYLHHRRQPRRSIKKRVTITFGSDRKWEAMSEREKLERGRRRLSCSGTVYVESTLLYS